MAEPLFGETVHLGRALFGFLAQHPEIELTLELEDRFVNMSEEGYDAVIRHGPVDDLRVIVKRLAVSRFGLGFSGRLNQGSLTVTAGVGHRPRC
jgi:DNA-binding transcriptional LysR family regulator